MWTIWSLIWALDTVVKMGVFLDSIICSAGILNATTTLGSGIQKICSAISTHDDCIVASVANKKWAKSRQKLQKIAANDPKVAQFLDEPTRPVKHPNWAFFY